MKEYTIYQLWAFSKKKLFSTFVNWLKQQEWPMYLDAVRGVVVQVPED